MLRMLFNLCTAADESGIRAEKIAALQRVWGEAFPYWQTYIPTPFNMGGLLRQSWAGMQTEWLWHYLLTTIPTRPTPFNRGEVPILRTGALFKHINIKRGKYAGKYLLYLLLLIGVLSVPPQ